MGRARTDNRRHTRTDAAVSPRGPGSGSSTSAGHDGGGDKRVRDVERAHPHHGGRSLWCQCRRWLVYRLRGLGTRWCACDLCRRRRGRWACLLELGRRRQSNAQRRRRVFTRQARALSLHTARCSRHWPRCLCWRRCHRRRVHDERVQRVGTLAARTRAAARARAAPPTRRRHLDGRRRGCVVRHSRRRRPSQSTVVADRPCSAAGDGMDRELGRPTVVGGGAAVAAMVAEGHPTVRRAGGEH